MKKWLLILGLAALACPFRLNAVVPDPDKKEPKLIAVKGESSQLVPVNAFRLKLSYKTEKRSFEDAAKSGSEIISKIKESCKQASPTRVIRGWDIIKQSRIAVGDKGRQIAQKIIIEYENVPAGKLYESLACAIDGVLAAGADIEIDQVESYLPNEKENEIQAALGKKAAEVALKNAQQMAAALQAPLKGPYRITPGGDVSPMMKRREEYSVLTESMVSIQKGFKVNTEVNDTMEMTASVSVLFEIQ